MKLLHDLLDEAAATWPDHEAVRGSGVTYSYHGLRERSIGLAGWLARHGVETGNRVVIQAVNHPDAVALLYATSRVGAVFVHLHPGVQDYQLAHILADSEPSLMITDRDRPPPGSLRPLVVLRLDELPRDLDDWQRPEPPCLSVDPACLIYTSGSTAMPKAVVSPHATMLFAARAIQQRLRYRTEDTVLCALPLSFDYGLYQALLTCLAGATLVLASDRDAGPTLLATLVRERATVLPAVPSMAAALARLLERQPAATSLRLLTNTGAAMPAGVLARLRAELPDLGVHLMFGLTECKRVTIMPIDGDLRRPGSSGTALPDTDISVVDTDGRRLPAGIPGELVVRGAHVMAGYWRAPDATARRFRTTDEGRYELHTGDMCTIDEDGYLYFAGRTDDQYKSRGFRVSAIEIEAAAIDVPGVEAAALLVPTESRPPTLVVTATVDASDVLKELASRLESHKVPDRCVRVPELPLTGSGKIDKRALASLLDREAP